MIYAKDDEVINKENINQIFNAFAKEYKKNCGNTPIEILIVGGCSVLLNYGFREASRDIDAYIKNKPIGLRQTIIKVSDKLNLPDDWLNTDFMTLSSSSTKLSEISKYYRELNNGTIQIRTVEGKYLIAMKMQSGREFGNDIPDIIGIIKEEKEKGNNITFDEIMKSADYLYGENFKVSDNLLKKVEEYCSMNIKDLDGLYKKRIELSENVLEKILDNKEKCKLNKVSTKELANIISERLEKEEMQTLSKNDIKSKVKPKKKKDHSPKKDE